MSEERELHGVDSRRIIDPTNCLGLDINDDVVREHSGFASGGYHDCLRAVDDDGRPGDDAAAGEVLKDEYTCLVHTTILEVDGPLQLPR